MACRPRQPKLDFVFGPDVLRDLSDLSWSGGNSNITDLSCTKRVCPLPPSGAAQPDQGSQGAQETVGCSSVRKCKRKRNLNQESNP